MHRLPAKLLAVVASAGALAGGGAALAHGGEGHGKSHSGSTSFRAALTGYQEVPAVSTQASGEFRARLRNGVVQWRLSARYADRSTPAASTAARGATARTTER